MTNSDDVVLEYSADGASPDEAGGYREMSWKGLGCESSVVDDGFEEPVMAGKGKSIAEGQLDMTPMVDVTFLLLIFFMVTASFMLQKSINIPPVQTGAGSPVDEDFVDVLIDRNNTFYVSSREDEVECPSEREMWTRVKEAKENSDIDRMTIRAHVDSKHRKVVSAWDAGVVAGIEKISIETTEEEL